LFAGASLASAGLDTDDDANKTVYGKPLTATEIVREGSVKPTPAGERIVAVLKGATPKYSGS
jgi:lipid-binding SYLF domain-containing protein